MDLHDLTPAYALDALDPDERVEYEAHLAACEQCRAELEGFWQVTGALGRAANGPPPPPRLRARILEQARSERPNVVPLRPRTALRSAGAAAAAAAAVAIGVGVWATSMSSDLDDARRELAVLGDPGARVYPTADGAARLVVAPSGAAALVVGTLPEAPEGKVYEIWVLEGPTPRPAGLFDGRGVALLSRPVEPGQTVAVTLERAGGVEAPTGEPLLTATRS